MFPKKELKKFTMTSTRLSMEAYLNTHSYSKKFRNLAEIDIGTNSCRKPYCQKLSHSKLEFPSSNPSTKVILPTPD